MNAWVVFNSALAGIWLMATLYDSGLSRPRSGWVVPDAMIFLVMLVGIHFALKGDRR